ncbi:MAG: GNAT family N-acetyltransferase [Gemmatimonadaceae bacterium]
MPVPFLPAPEDMPDTSEEVEITEVRQAEHLDQVRGLFREYGASLLEHAGSEAVLRVQGFDEELASLPGDYGPPQGALLLALVNGAPAGCASLRPLGGDTLELKRLYVRPEYRGQSLGRRLVAEALDHASRSGARSVRLDTLPFMRSAARLYRAMGFEEIPAYRPNPMPGSRFFEIVVDPAEPAARLVEFRPEFAPAFERLNREWLDEFFRVEAKDLRFFRDPGGTILDPGGQIFFVTEGERPVGTCAVIRESAEDYELAKMAVQSDCRGKGYGQWLVSAVVEFVRARGGRRLYLLSDEKLVDALRLYERMGFRRRPFPGGTGYARGDVYMELAIDGGQ